MGAPRKCPEELRERSIRLALAARNDPRSRAGACRRVGQRGLPPVRLTHRVCGSGRGCDRSVEQFELYRGEPAEGSLASSPVVALLDPGHDREAELLAGGPALTV